MTMTLFQAAVLGIVEGLTEFLPVSSTGHLTVAEQLLGLDPGRPEVTAFTAVVQSGAVAAVVVYFRGDLVPMAATGLRALVNPDARKSDHARLAGWLILATLPIAVVGLLARPVIEGPMRSLWWVAAGLSGWSLAMWHAERRATQNRSLEGRSRRDAVLMGLAQCVALVPGVSRSGATISAGLLGGLDRVAATRLSFLLAVPALGAATVLELPGAVRSTDGVAVVAVGVAVAFVVAYASIHWLLRLVAHRPITAFIPYRLLAGGAIALLAAGALAH